MSLIDEIKVHEGFRDKVYKCSEGFDTIGYGFAIKDLVLDEDIADLILQRKLEDLQDFLKSSGSLEKEMELALKLAQKMLDYKDGQLLVIPKQVQHLHPMDWQLVWEILQELQDQREKEYLH